MKYQAKQFVYTSKKIYGWFDYSLQNAIPANTLCQITSIVTVGETDDKTVYAVRFLDKNKEFGDFHLKHSDLKLM